MHKSDTATIIGSLRILVNDIQSDDGIANMAIAEAADRMEEMQTREKNLSQKLCCFTGESLEDAADRLREEHNKAKMETESWKAQVKVRMGLMKELKDAMGIDGSEDELKAALKYVKGLKAQIDGLSGTIDSQKQTHDALIKKLQRSSRPTLDQTYP